ncbi:MAG: hypothetical protein ACO3AA_02455 [Chitinophagaceae bacterium]
MAQRFGGNPPALKWKQLENDKVKVIFPFSRLSEAQRIANIVTQMSGDSTGTLGNRSVKIPIVLQSLPLISNGYVGLAPWRSEFFMTPLQNSLDLGSTAWVDNLSIHEYRHVHQYSNFRKGASKLMYLLAGQEGQSLANAASIPDWFFEGDAVYTETKYLQQGRGRLPYFFDAFNAIWTAEKKYGFQKLRNGSMKDFVPDHYQLGYMLVAHGVNKYGNDFWGKVTDDASRFKGLIYPFQKAVKRYAGITYRQFVGDALESFKQDLSSSKNINKEITLSVPTTKRLVDYHFPVWINDDTVLALRKPLNQLPHWVLITGSTSQKIGLKYIGIDDYFNVKKDKLVYTAYNTDTRWDWKEFNDIYLFDIKSRTTTRITKNKRLFSPDISDDLQTIVSIDMPADGGSSMQFWQPTSKQLLESVQHPNGYMLSFPVFGSSDQDIYVVGKKPDGNSSILSYNRSAHSFNQLFPFVNAPIAFLRHKNDWLIFSISQSGRNELWGYHLVQKTFTKFSSSNTGTYAGDIHKSSVVYSRPTAEGEQLFVGTLTTSNHQETFQSVLPLYNVKFDLNEQKKDFPDSSYQVSSYSSQTQLMNIHSWRPYYERPNWSFSLYSQNVLNTLQSTYQYVFNENEKSHQFGAYATYGALYPWMIGGTNYTFNRNFKDSTRNLLWNEWNGNIGLRIPLSNNSGRFFRSLDISSTWNNAFFNYDATSKPVTTDKHVSYLHFQLVASMLKQQAKQQVNSRFGWVLNLQHRTPFGKIDALQSYAGLRIYLPGIIRTHSFNMHFAYQERDTLRQYIYTNNFAMARGYAAFNYPRMWRVSFNYHFPVLYPDLGFANIVYFRRIRSNLFFDDMNLKSLRTGRVIQLRSTGIEIHFDTKWWNQHPVSFGFRYSRLLDAKKFTDPPNVNRWEFIMPVNLIPN